MAQALAAAVLQPAPAPEHPQDARQVWLDELEQRTQLHRERRARKLEARAREVAQHMRHVQFASERQIEQKTKWYRSRAKGSRERFSRVASCGTEYVASATCKDCGCVHEVPVGCSSRLLCPTCRGRQNAKRRARFRASRSAVLDQGRKWGLLRRRRKGGRYTEKFLTLTVPAAGLSHMARIAACFVAKSHMARYLRAKCGAFGAYHLTFEWTAGTELQGHPHFHAWAFSSFIPKAELEAAWRASLLRAGIPADQLATLVVHVREATGNVDQELIKYLTKDFCKSVEHGQPVYAPPGLYAELYTQIDGRHLCESSKGFSKLAPISRCGDCGAARYVQKWSDPPPALFMVEVERNYGTGPPAEDTS